LLLGKTRANSARAGNGAVSKNEGSRERAEGSQREELAQGKLKRWRSKKPYNKKDLKGAGVVIVHYQMEGISPCLRASPGGKKHCSILPKRLRKFCKDQRKKQCGGDHRDHKEKKKKRAAIAELSDRPGVKKQFCGRHGRWGASKVHTA